MGRPRDILAKLREITDPTPDPHRDAAARTPVKCRRVGVSNTASSGCLNPKPMRPRGNKSGARWRSTAVRHAWREHSRGGWNQATPAAATHGHRRMPTQCLAGARKSAATSVPSLELLKYVVERAPTLPDRRARWSESHSSVGGHGEKDPGRAPRRAADPTGRLCAVGQHVEWAARCPKVVDDDCPVGGLQRGLSRGSWLCPPHL